MPVSEKDKGDSFTVSIGRDGAFSKEGDATVTKAASSKKGPCEKFLSAMGKKLDGMLGLG